MTIDRIRRNQIAIYYKDDAGNYHDSDSFSGTELLRIAHLASRAYDRVSGLRQQERANDSRVAS